MRILINECYNIIISKHQANDTTHYQFKKEFEKLSNGLSLCITILKSSFYIIYYKLCE